MLMACLQSGVPAPAESSRTYFARSKSRLSGALPSSPSRCPLGIEKGARAIDAQRAMGDGASVGRSTAAAQQPPFLAVQGGDARDIREFEIAPARLDVDPSHQLGLGLDCLQHLRKGDGSLRNGR